MTCQTLAVTQARFRKVVVCPDKFAGTLDAEAVGAAIAEGLASAAPEWSVTVLPLSDGGPGFLDAIRDGRRFEVPTVDPLGRPVAGEVLLAGHTAYVESAQACGLHLLTPAERDPLRATSYGLGVLLAAAVESGASEIVVGLGGSGTNDAGAGMLAALGAALLQCAQLGGVPRLRSVRLVAATDVDSPLTGPLGASAVYGPQKGASSTDVALLDAALARFASVLSSLDTCPPAADLIPGAGAAGGIGAALLACGGRVVSGFGVVRAAAGLDAALAGCDLVITGEGSFDDQSLRGKVAAGVAAMAREKGVPCVVLAGRVAVDADAAAAAGVTAAYSLVDHVGLDRALGASAESLTSLAATLPSRLELA